MNHKNNPVVIAIITVALIFCSVNWSMASDPAELQTLRDAFTMQKKGVMDDILRKEIYNNYIRELTTLENTMRGNMRSRSDVNAVRQEIRRAREELTAPPQQKESTPPPKPPQAEPAPKASAPPPAPPKPKAITSTAESDSEKEATAPKSVLPPSVITQASQSPIKTSAVQPPAMETKPMTPAPVAKPAPKPAAPTPAPTAKPAPKPEPPAPAPIAKPALKPELPAPAPAAKPAPKPEPPAPVPAAKPAPKPEPPAPAPIKPAPKPAAPTPAPAAKPAPKPAAATPAPIAKPAPKPELPAPAPAAKPATKPEPPAPAPAAKPATKPESTPPKQVSRKPGPQTHVSSVEGMAGNAKFTKNNVYTFNLPAVGKSSTLAFWATGRHSTDSKGNVWLTTPDGKRKKVSQWKDSYFEYSSTDVYSYYTLKPVTEDISELVTKPGQYKVEFEWTGGAEPLVIFRVEITS